MYAETLYGLASFLLSSRFISMSSSKCRYFIERDAVVAVAIGGTAMNCGRGKIIGTFVLMLSIINTLFIMANVPPFLNGVVTGIVIIIAVLAQSRKKQ